MSKIALVAFDALEESGAVYLTLKFKAESINGAFDGLSSIIKSGAIGEVKAQMPPPIETHKKEAAEEFKRKSEEAKESRIYAVGDEYEGSAITESSEHEKEGVGVLILLSGLRVKYDLKTGEELARKGDPIALLAKEESLGAIFRGACKLMDRELVETWIMRNMGKLDAVRDIAPIRLKERIQRLKEQS